MYALALVMLLMGSGGLIEQYENLIAVNPGRSHAKRVQDLNKLLPKIIDDLEYRAVGFYAAPADRKLELHNKNAEDIFARRACFDEKGKTGLKDDWFAVAPDAKTVLECPGDDGWIFVEWGGEEPVPGAIREILPEDP